MKNIHLIPTDKEQHSIVQKHTGLLLIQTPRKEYSGTKLNIYITSNEEIKEGDWFYSVRELIEKAIINYPKRENFGKIILTTDQFLIDNGVQAIDDEFLEWFVKNPSCESVDIDYKIKSFIEISHPSDKKSTQYIEKLHKIIVPQEEPKTNLEKHLDTLPDSHFIRRSAVIPQEEPKQECTCGVCDNCEEKESIQILKEAKENALKQETLEEAATKVLDRKYPYHRPSDAGYWKDMFISGAKWMEEEMEKLKDFDTWKEWKNK